ncbi:MAG: hypothetical protein PHR87_08875 [Sulfurospirillaceae bacterium]|nr:hypothetical protein [Sulfurospirillaceae bacterium]
MILIGHPLIAYKPFYGIQAEEDIGKTPSNATVIFDFNATLAAYCQSQKIIFALHVKNIKELILAHALEASYFIVDKSLAINAQKVADDYMFDGKVMLASNDEADIEFVALSAIDGILFNDSIITV